MARPTDLFFSEYIEGSSFNKAIEIFNGTLTSIDLSQYSIVLYSNGSTTPTATLALSGSLASGQVFVAAHGSANAEILAAADVTNSSAINWNGDDAVVLMKNGQIIDVIGQIGFDPGAEWSANGVRTANQTIVRTSTIDAGDTDGSNAFDPSAQWVGSAQDDSSNLGSHTFDPGVEEDGPVFSIAATAASKPEGNSGTTAFTFTVTRSGDTSVAASVNYAVAGAGANAADAADFSGVLSGTVEFAANQTSKEITVNIAGDTVGETDETFSVILSDPSEGASIAAGSATGTIINDDSLPITKISAVQGAGDASGMLNQTVTIEAIVVGDFQDGDGDDSRDMRGFFLQEEAGDWDANSATSEGIFIYDGTSTFQLDVDVGDKVLVTGIVKEYFGITEIDISGPGGSVTIVEADAVADVNAMAQAISLPTSGVTTSQSNDYQPDLEAYEGMLVTVPDKLTITEQFQLDRFNEIKLFDAEGFVQKGSDGEDVTGLRPFQYTQHNDPSAAGLDEYLKSVGARTITYDDGLNAQNAAIGNLDGFQGYSTATAPRMGDTVTGLTGVLDYAWAGNSASQATWRIRAVEDGANEFVSANERPETGTAGELNGELKVSSFNVLNFFTTIDEEIDGEPPRTDIGMEPRGANNEIEYGRQLDKLVAALGELDADIIGLLEIENEFSDDGGNVPPIQELVDALNAAEGENVWDYVDPGQNFVGGDAIAVAAIYRKDKVKIADGTTIEILDDDAPEAQAVIKDPASGTDRIFNGEGSSRTPLAVTFEELASGEEITVVVNHFKSKGSAGAAVGDADMGDGQGYSNQSRLNAAKALVDWLENNPTGSSTTNQLIIGDLNSYASEDPIQFLEEAGFLNAAQELIDNAYGYVFDGMIGTLDYILASASMFGDAANDIASKVVDFLELHINADEADALDYNTDFGRDPSYFDGNSPVRASDHDPLVIGLDLTPTDEEEPGTGGPEEPGQGGQEPGEGQGTPNRDIFTGSPGNDNFDGGAGTDYVKFSGPASAYQIVFGANGLPTGVTGPEGTDTFTGIERLIFADGVRAFDEGPKDVFRLYEAAFGRNADVNGISWWVGQQDAGEKDIIEVARDFLYSPEFATRFGDVSALSLESLINVFYTNILGRPGEAAGTSYWLQQLQNGMSKEHMLVLFAESAENSATMDPQIVGGVLLNDTVYA